MSTKRNAVMAFKDDEYQAITNQFKQIQECIGMYISEAGTAGAIHLLKDTTNGVPDSGT